MDFGLRSPRSVSSTRLFPEVLPEPFHVASCGIEHQPWFLESVRRSRVNNHPYRYPMPFERIVELGTLADGDALVALVVLNERWSRRVLIY